MEQDQPQGGRRPKEAGEERLSREAQPIQAVVFDLDGTLVDSEPNYRVTDERFVAAKGVPVSELDWDDIVGMGGGPFMELLRSRFGVEGSADGLLAEKDALYLDYAAGRTHAFPAMLELVRYLYVHGYSLAVGTSSQRKVLDASLAEAGLSGYFSATVSRDDVARSKPEPDTFLEAARRLDVAPHRCMVIEDSQYGVEAASRAGMRVVAVPAPGTETLEAFRKADVVIVGGPARLDPTGIVARFGLAPRNAQAGETAKRFSTVVRDFYKGARRPMPWREESDPYRILVSEFMLQQTQVARVEPKYRAFLERFPTVDSLARASLQDVLSFWQGLGYNRRGRNLREAARAIVERFAGCVPRDVDALKSLPGVGPYTAAAVAAFAFESPVVVVETNIRRLFIHFFHPLAESVHDREIEPLVESMLIAGSRTLGGSVRHWYYALMDYGAWLGRLAPNANRRSSHYARQSPFAGSVREVRGRIVRALTQRRSVSIEELELAVGPTDSRLAAALEGLERDGMIAIEGRRISLR